MAALNIPKAVRNNPIYARITEPPWMDRFPQVARELGFRDMSPSAESFAEAVHSWQKKNPGLAADGMLGPKTWAKLEPRTRYSLPVESPPPWISEMPPGWKPDVPDLPERNGVTDVIDEMIRKDPSYQTTLTNTGVTIASIGLGQLPKIGTVAGGLVQPLVWAYQGNTGDLGDKVLYGLGLFPPLTVAAGLVSIWKGYLDDKVLAQLEEVYADEPAHLKKAIFPAATYTLNATPDVAAMRIAGDGGVAWKHPNGLWVYLKLEKNGKEILVCDYRPRNAVAVVGPELPLRPVGKKFVWRMHKGRW